MSLYDEAAVALIAEGAAGKDGVLYNIKPEEKLKAAELITNGGFDTDSDWLKTAGVTISGGKARMSDTSDVYRRIEQQDVFTVGKTYRVSVNLVVNLGTVKIGTEASANSIGLGLGSGQHSFYFTADANDLYIAKDGAANGYDIEIDNVSVKEVEQEALDFTFTRGSNLTATRVAPSGYIEKGRENLIKYSNTLDGTGWVNTTGTPANYNAAVSGQSGYDGSTNAWLIEKTTTVNSYIGGPFFGYDGVFTWSVYAKNEGTKNNGLHMYTPYATGYFDLVNGTIDLEGGSNKIEVKMEPVTGSAGDTDRWYRCSVTGVGEIVDNDNEDRPRFKIVNIDGSDESGGADGAYSSTGKIFVQNFQFEAGLVATEYIESHSTTGKAGILEDSPRFDYTGGGCPHLLMEPTRINLIKNSEYLGDYSTSNATITTNALTSPEGLDNATTINVTSNSGSVYAQSGGQLASVTASTKYTFSFYVKQGTNTENYLAVRDQNAESFISEDVAYTASSSEWKRIEHTFTTPAGCTSVRLYPSRYDSGGQGTTHLFGIQLEKGAYATSYIPNHGTSAGETRDNEYTPSTDFGDYIDGKDFTFFVDLAKNESLLRDNSSGGIRFSTSNLTASSVRLYRASGSATTYHAVWFDSELKQDPDPKSFSGSTPKVAIRRIKSTGEWAMFVDGSKVQTQYNTNYSDFKHLKIWGEGSPVHLNGTIVFDRALTDDECIALTT